MKSAEIQKSNHIDHFPYYYHLWFYYLGFVYWFYATKTYCAHCIYWVDNVDGKILCNNLRTHEFKCYSIQIDFY
jgi:hypothetical protein